MTHYAQTRLLFGLMACFLLVACTANDQPSPEEPTAATDDGFVSVFNGVDLTGWTGDVDGYAVEGGAIVCLKDGGGNLYIDIAVFS